MASKTWANMYTLVTKNLISKKIHITNRMLCLELNYTHTHTHTHSLSLSHHTIFAFCCWHVIVCCFLVTSCRLVGGHTPLPPSDVFGWTLSKPFDNNSNCQTQGRTSFGPRRMLSVPCPLKVYSLVREIRCVSHPWSCHLH
jgi:hypothetical protein